MSEKKTIWQETKETIKWFVDMTTFRNIVVCTLAFLAFVAFCFFIAGVFAICYHGYNYTMSLYNAAGPDGKLGLIGGILGAFVGVGLTLAGGAVIKKIKKK